MSSSVGSVSQSLYAKLRQLRVPGDAGWVPLPDWANFFASIGSGMQTATLNRTIAAVALPTRVGAAAFVLTGMSIARMTGMEVADASQHFEALRELPVGTPVAFYDRKNNRKQRGLIQRFETIYGAQYIFIQKSPNGKEIQGFREDMAYHVEKLPPVAKWWKPFGWTSGVAAGTLTERLAGKEVAFRYANSTSAEALIIGRRHLLQNELAQIILGVSEKQQTLASGSLQELVRLRLADHRPYQYPVITPGYRGLARIARMQQPRIVVFDGASAFVRSRHHWRSCHWIVLLDRTEPMFDDAVDIVNELYGSRVGEFQLPKLPLPPGGVELALFTR